MIYKNELHFVYFKTFAISCAFFCSNMAVSLLGPTMSTLAFNLQSNVADLWFLLPADGVGYILGSFVTQLIYKKCDSSLLLFLCLFITGVEKMLIPFLYPILLGIVTSNIGFSTGVLLTGGNVFMNELWGENSAPYIQLLNFSFALGGIITPLFAGPFIKSTSLLNNFNSTAVSTASTIRKTSFGFPEVAWAYFICAWTTLLVSFCFLLIYIKSVVNKMYTEFEGDKLQLNNNNDKKLKTSRTYILCLLFVFYFVYIGIESGFYSYIYTMVTSEPNFPMDAFQGTTVNSVFWISLTIGGLMGIFMSIKLSPTSMMVISLLLSATSACSFLFYPYFAANFRPMIWVTVAVYGLGLANMYPTMISWGGQYIDIDERAASIIVIGAGLGKMVIPPLISLNVEKNPICLAHINLVCIISLAVVFLILYSIAEKHGKKK